MTPQAGPEEDRVVRCLPADPRALVLQRGVLLRVEEVRAAQMGIPVGVGGADARRLDRCGNRGVQRVIAHHDARGRFEELTAYRTDHHVLGEEADSLVRLVEQIDAWYRNGDAVPRSCSGLCHRCGFPTESAG